MPSLALIGPGSAALTTQRPIEQSRTVTTLISQSKGTVGTARTPGAPAWVAHGLRPFAYVIARLLPPARSILEPVAHALALLGGHVAITLTEHLLALLAQLAITLEVLADTALLLG